MEPVSLYLHIPFCVRRCPYCDFNTYAGMESWIPNYIQALLGEIRLVAASAPAILPVHTIFFGGGTPSLLPVSAVDQVLGELAKAFAIQPGAEISLEANPGTVSLPHLEQLRKLGINRLSLGAQSFRPDELRLLGRIHSVPEIFQAYRWARRAGFENINLDLIYGLPGQNTEDWLASLNQAVHLQPDHLSLYSLTVEEGTPLHDWVGRGLVAAPDDDQAASDYDLAEQVLSDAGFLHYEISNWAAKCSDGLPRTCIHNLQYWRGLPYLGFGAGAHGFFGFTRTANEQYIPEFIRLAGSSRPATFPAGPAAVDVNNLDERVRMQEYMMVGMRLLEEGVSQSKFSSIFGKELADVFPDQLRRLLERGLIEHRGDSLRLAPSARLLANQVFIEFVGD